MPNSVVILDQRCAAGRWLVFDQPVATVSAFSLADVMPCLREVEEHTTRGLYAAGFVSYEAAAAMDPALVTRPPLGLPLIWFGFYKNPRSLVLPKPNQPFAEFATWRPSISVETYRASIEKIKRHIQDGDTYQVNYTFRMRSAFEGDPWEFFLQLYQAQRGSYSAYIDLGRYHVASASPELFFSLHHGDLTCRPMKGTVPRTDNSFDDAEAERWLHTSEKNRAENVMIVDMIRNDMGKIARTGSVRTESLFNVEKYPNVLQMTSTVTAKTAATLPKLFASMFPCASITGAPKIKTVQIIQQLEPDARGIYTGSIGFVAPNASCQFNVAIRTAVIDTHAMHAEYGVGSGVVWDSEADDEYEECLTKARILSRQDPQFDLLESMLWTSTEGLYLLDDHLHRLGNSAEHFKFKLDIEDLAHRLAECIGKLDQSRSKIRVVLARSGRLVIESLPLTSLRGSRVALAAVPIARSVFLAHKTTYRRPYTDLMDGLLGVDKECVDVIIHNDRGRVTESAIANIVIADQTHFFTPPLDDGLLPGVFRNHLLRTGVVEEIPISLADLQDARALFLVNSVRGWMPLRRISRDTWVIESDLEYQTPVTDDLSMRGEILRPKHP